MTQLYQLVQHVQKTGEVKALQRVSIMALADLLKEGIKLQNVTPQTDCSPQLYNKLKSVSEKFVGIKF